MRFPFRLTDSQWEAVKTFLPWQRRRKYPARTVLTAMLYVARTGCQWRQLPDCFPPWQTVYYYFRRWTRSGAWSRAMQALAERVRTAQGKAAEPSAAVVDSQSVRTAAGVSSDKGWDGAKKLFGRKRHLATDTGGLPLAVRVSSARVSDREGLWLLATRLRTLPLRVLFADSAYRGIRLLDGVDTVVVNRRTGGGAARFVPVPKRWVVERTFGWLSHWRRLARDYEKRSDCAQAFVQLALVAIMARRIRSET